MHCSWFKHQDLWYTNVEKGANWVASFKLNHESVINLMKRLFVVNFKVKSKYLCIKIRF